MIKHDLAKLPALDPAQFTPYLSARRSGVYPHMTITGMVIYTAQDQWVPIGYTQDPSVLDTTEVPSNLAIMWQDKDHPEDMTWWHVWASGLELDHKSDDDWVEVGNNPNHPPVEQKPTRTEAEILKLLATKPLVQSGGYMSSYRIGKRTVRVGTVQNMLSKGLIMRGEHPQNPGVLGYVVVPPAPPEAQQGMFLTPPGRRKRK